MHQARKTDSPMTPAGIERLEIRSPSEGDIQDLLALEHVCFDAPYYRPHRFTPSEFVSYLRNPDAVFWAAMQQQLLIGYIAGYRGVRSRSRSARIESLAVAPTARRRGIGGLLMRRFLDEAKRRGSRRVTLEVAEANERARPFFATLGFKPVRRLAAYYGGRYDGLRLGRAL